MRTGDNRAGAGGDPRHPNRLPPHRAAEAALDFNTAPSPWEGRLRSHHDALGPLRALARPVPGIAPRLRELLPDGRPRTVYIHVPFCTHNCTFCNLNRRWATPPPDYADLLVQEIESFSDYPYVTGGAYGAVYFGGGTPTVLAPQDLKRVIRALRGSLDIALDAEITVETTVSDLTPAHIHALREAGVNRISVGIQTFCDRGRRYLGRWGSGEEAARKLEELLSAGFRNVGIDLIYNWPGQSEEELLEDLEIIESLDLAGLSFYALILMEGTALHRMVSTGQCPPIGDLEKEKRFFDLILNRLLDRGFVLHELTKLVKPNRDEYKYVRIRYGNGDTLALGAGAGGRLGNLIYRNPSDLAAYRQQVESPTGLPASAFLVDRRYDFAYLLIGKLQFGRLDWADLDSLPDAKEALRPLIEALAAGGLVKTDSHGLSLTREGIFWGNNIGREFATALVKLFKGGDVIAHPGIAQKDAKAGHHPATG